MVIRLKVKHPGSVIASLLHGRRISSDDSTDLYSVGLGDTYQAARGLPMVSWPHFKISDRVSIAGQSKTKAWRFIASTGMTGVVEKLIQGNVVNGVREEDLYKVKLDAPRNPSNPVAYLTYQELSIVLKEES